MAAVANAASDEEAAMQSVDAAKMAAAAVEVKQKREQQWQRQREKQKQRQRGQQREYMHCIWADVQCGG